MWTEPRSGREDLIQRLEEAGCEIIVGRPFTDAQHPFSQEELIEYVSDLDALMVGSREAFPREVLAAGKRLVTVAKLGIGIERIDVKAATDLGILVSNTPIPENYLAVAEGTLARILALAKNLKLADRNARLGQWRSITNVYLKGKVIGLVGFGRIGRRVAELLRPFEVEVLAYDPLVSPEAAVELNVELVELDTLLQRADFVSLHAVVTPQNRDMIGERELALMKPTAYLINTARGALVDEQALAAALNSERLAGAALDVFEPEPPHPDNSLLSEGLFYRTVFSPHTASATPELSQRMPEVMVENCLAALRGEVPEYTVNPEVIPRWRARLPSGGQA